MRKPTAYIALALLFPVTGCAGFALDELKRITPEGPAFTRNLTREYLKFASVEAGEMYDGPDSRHFALKGLKSAAGEAVAPEALGEWMLPRAVRPALAVSRARLVALLDGGARKRAPEAAARAQAAFDCWVEQQEENWQADDIEACRARFFTALAEIESALRAKAAPEPAHPEPAGFEIRFPFDSAAPDDSTHLLLDRAAARIKAGVEQRLIVQGHADRAGEAPYNLELSLRRAVAVWRALIARGVPPQRLLLQALGEGAPRVATKDGAREPANRRAAVLLWTGEGSRARRDRKENRLVRSIR
jgi:OOP family OmpA-OmpF porin